MNMWQTNGLFLTWGLRGGDFTPEAIAAKAAQAGFKWIARALQDDCACPPELTSRLRVACHNHGIHYNAWMSQPLDIQRFIDDKPNASIFNIEAAEPHAETMLQLYRKLHPTLPCAIITNFYEIDPKPWLRHGVACLPETYTGEDAEATIQAQTARARGYGWRPDMIAPTLGLFHGYPFDAYKLPFTRAPFSIYCAETMSDQDWHGIRDFVHV